MKLFFIGIVFVLIILLYLSVQEKEGFLNGYCNKYNDCTSCAKASGCSWCPKQSVCLSSTTLKSTDTLCNQSNTIHSEFRCKSVTGDEVIPDSVESNDILYDFNLYRNKITDKIPPPNVYMAGNIQYSNQDIVSNTNNLRNDLENYQKGLPGIIASSVENSIKPMVKGILADNYYIQGFTDMKANECGKINSCSSCVNDTKCGWDPRKMACDNRGPNKSWYITQPTRCVTTPSTLSLMTKSPN
jgi:hypothetical protein